ncbi:MAG: aminotransferase class V-fold PLP-dependent enzyme [Crocinitomicaceae bacterium]
MNNLLKDKFLLHPDITFLNHGSFGACPKPVFEAYQRFQLELEREPIQFITKTGMEYLKTSREALANYVHCDAQDLVYTTNPSTALNTVIKSLDLKPGDEILTTDQEYGAMDMTWRYYCRKSGASYIRQEIPLPLASKEDFLSAFWKGLSPKTKVVFISAITSPTALIFPVAEICQKARELGLMTIIDGAHVPSQIPLNLKELDPDVYTGACHKWMLAPKGSSFLYVKRKHQSKIDPLIISWGYEAKEPSGSVFQDYHTYQGTRDFSAFLVTPHALKFLDEHNWEEEKKRCRSLLKEYYPIVAKKLNSNTIAPITDEFLGQICSIPINTFKPIELKNLLYEKYRIEIPVIEFENDIYLRISFQAYNGPEEIETLIDAINKIQATTNLLV